VDLRASCSPAGVAHLNKHLVHDTCSKHVNMSAGPAVSVDTACSSAMVAAHLGRQHLAATAGSALAAGINLMLAETTTAAAHAAGMLTADGRCKALDASADGYVRSEACVAVLLTAHTGGSSDGGGGGSSVEGGSSISSGGDFYGAVLRSTYVNQDGRSSSLTAPNGPSQQQVGTPSLEQWHVELSWASAKLDVIAVQVLCALLWIPRSSHTSVLQVLLGALRVAEVQPADISRLEMHGTGTPLGAPL